MTSGFVFCCRTAAIINERLSLETISVTRRLHHVHRYRVEARRTIPEGSNVVQNKNGRVFRPSRSKLSSTSAAQLKPQLAFASFFSNTGLPTFFWIARLKSSAFGDRS